MRSYRTHATRNRVRTPKLNRFHPRLSANKNRSWQLSLEQQEEFVVAAAAVVVAAAAVVDAVDAVAVVVAVELPQPFVSSSPKLQDPRAGTSRRPPRRRRRTL